VRALVLVVLAVAACGRPTSDEPGTCLALPGARRRSLIADPAGKGLYWLEAERIRDWDGDIDVHWNLVHFDLRTRRSERVSTYNGSPLIANGEDVLGLRYNGNAAIARFRRDGTVEDLTPDYLDVLDFELVKGGLVFIAEGEGPRAAYSMTLEGSSPTYLVDADTLLATAGDKVFLRTKDAGIALDLHTGARSSFKPSKHLTPLASDEVEVEDWRIVAHSMLDGSVRPLLPAKLPWDLRYSPGAVLARTPPDHELSEAVLLTPGDAITLPTLTGGTSLLGVTVGSGDRWALVGHNTANYLGDLAEIDPEADVCLLPATGTVAFPTRVVPKRYEATSSALFDTLERVWPGAKLQLFDGEDSPVTLDIRVKEPAAADAARMRDTARKLHHGVTSVLGDREIRTRVTFLDERNAVVRFRRSRMRERAFVGMGDALMRDPSEDTVELRDGSGSIADGKIKCSGAVINTQSAKLAGLSVHCIWGDRVRTIAVPELAPGASFAFDQTYDVDADANLHIQIYRGPDPVEFFDTGYEARMKQVFDLAATVYAASGLALDTHSTTDDIVVSVRAQSSFASLPEAERARFVTKAYEGYGALREIYKLPVTTSMQLRVIVQGLPITYEYDGTTLTTID
jgi:hypothetical protein